jgi:methylaspartate ammonia-lyase
MGGSWEETTLSQRGGHLACAIKAAPLLKKPALDIELVFYYTFSHVYLATFKTVAERLTAKEEILLHLG